MDGNRDAMEYYWVDVDVYKNSTDNKNNAIGGNSDYNGYCKATISWSPTINNS